MFSFSIIINTFNRANSLGRTLESLRWLRYAGKFEVIVVNGPSVDETEDVIKAWEREIRSATCPQANLAMSRNIGISMARGDIIAFIDDDAIPEPEWLEHLSDGYGYRVAAVGGAVYDDGGHTFQFMHSTANRLGRGTWINGYGREDLCIPGSFEFPYLQGTNASFRRDALLRIGGFDEEFEYYLDETDVCCRLVDEGFIIRQVANALVHHKSERSAVRDDRKVLIDIYPIIKNKIYFSFKHAQSHLAHEAILADNRDFSDGLLGYVRAQIAAKNFAEEQFVRFEGQYNRAWEQGTKRGIAQAPRLLSKKQIRETDGIFKEFPVFGTREKRAFVLVERDCQSLDRLQAIASTGLNVFLVTLGKCGHRVEFVKGVWVHSIPENEGPWQDAISKEVDRIGRHRPVTIL